MTYARARAELRRFTVKAIRPGLSRTRVLLRALGRPDRFCPAIQVTGSNGKGSVTALIAASLAAAGFRVGRFTSPHLKDERERISLNGDLLSPRAFSEAVERLLPGLRALYGSGRPATAFEAWTVLAAVAFQQAAMEVAVLEVGLGGRLDATTAWQNIILTLLTHVSLEHTRELGKDLEAICLEKAAIARPGVPMLSAETHPNLRRLLRKESQKKKFPLFFAGLLPKDACRLTGWQRTARGIRVDLELPAGSYPQVEVGLRGGFQAQNAALAALAVKQVSELGFPVPDSAWRKGFKTVQWPGRLERIAGHPVIYLDGAHNPDAAEALAEEVAALAGQADWIVGIMADKDVAGVVAALTPVARRVWTIKPPDERGLPAPELAEAFQSMGVEARASQSLYAALTEAIHHAGRKGTVVVAGSLYNIAPARSALKRLGMI